MSRKNPFSRHSALVLALAKTIAIAALMLATGFGLLDRSKLLMGQERYVTLLFYWGVWGASFFALLIAAFQPNRWVRTFWAIVIAATTAAGWPIRQCRAPA